MVWREANKSRNGPRSARIDRTASASFSSSFSRSSPQHPLAPPAMALSDRRSSLIPVPILPRNVGSADLASQALDTPVKGRSSPAPSSSPSPSSSNHHRPEHYAKLGLTRLPVSVVSEYLQAGFRVRRTRETRGERREKRGRRAHFSVPSFLFSLPFQVKEELCRVGLNSLPDFYISSRLYALLEKANFRPPLWSDGSHPSSSSPHLLPGPTYRSVSSSPPLPSSPFLGSNGTTGAGTAPSSPNRTNQSSKVILDLQQALDATREKLVSSQAELRASQAQVVGLSGDYERLKERSERSKLETEGLNSVVARKERLLQEVSSSGSCLF